MANLKVAKRYAKGLYQFAESSNETAEIYKEMQSLSELIGESNDLKNFLKSPILDYKTKQGIAAKLFASYSKTTQTFINLVISHGREANLREIANEYIIIDNVKNHIKIGVLTTASEISKELADQIIDKSKLLQKEDKLEIKHKIDPAILGGYILQIGDKQIDASVKNKFTKLKQQFDDNQYIPKF